MAYMDFRGIEHAPVTGPATRRRADTAATPSDAVDFTPLEWTVIALARAERTPARSSHAARLMALLFGDDRARPLADPRLEALRQAAIALWHRRAPQDAKGLARHGFTPAQGDLLAASIAAARR